MIGLFRLNIPLWSCHKEVWISQLTSAMIEFMLSLPLLLKLNSRNPSFLCFFFSYCNKNGDNGKEIASMQNFHIHVCTLFALHIILSALPSIVCFFSLLKFCENCTSFSLLSLKLNHFSILLCFETS